MIFDKKTEEFCHDIDIFQNFSIEELVTINQLFKKVTLKADQYLFFDKMKAKELYVIISGVIKIIKNNIEITKLTTKNYIGELPLLDQGDRSASAQAETDSELLSLSLDELKQYPTLHEKLIVNLSHTVASRLRQSNKTAVDAIKKEIEILKWRARMGSFVSYFVAMLSLYLISLRLISAYWPSLIPINPDSSMRGIVIIALVMLFIIRNDGYPLRFYGISLTNWKTSIVESFLLTLPVIVILIVATWSIFLFLHHGNVAEVITVFKTNLATINLESFSAVAVGYLLFAPVSEFIARGCIQGSLQQLLIGRYSQVLSIIIASLIYSSLFVYLKPVIPLMMAILGLFWGWLYARQKTLLGVSLSHWLIAMVIYSLGVGVNII